VTDCANAIVGAMTSEQAVGRAYNLVGDVRPTAREYLADVAQVTGRPLKFVPSSPVALWLAEMGKWLVKRATGRRVQRPYLRDIRSRGISAMFDCSAAKRDLDWAPVADAKTFRQMAVMVHAEEPVA